MRVLICPECGSEKLVKVGKVWSGRVLKQQHQCKACGRLTVKPLEVEKGELVPKPA